MSFGLGFRLYLNFPGRIVLILGVCLAILGILDIVLAVTGFVQKIWGHYYATGIWCGVVIFIDGLCGILASQTRTNFAVKTFFVFSIISVLVSFVMIILSCGGLDFYSNFYDRVFSYYGKHGRATKAVHGTLLALALVEFVVSIINAILCLKSSCHDKKTSIKYDQSKVKQSSLHRPPSYKDSEQPHGFRGGNPNSVPVSEEAKVRRYQSPRRSHNGTRIYQEENAIDEPTETTEFLPNAFASVEKELCEREKRRQRQHSKEHDDNKDTHPNKVPTRGRMYRRQHEQTTTETKPTKINNDNQRKVQTNSGKLNTTQQHAKNENDLNRWKQADELVQSHQYYHMRHSDKTQPNKIPKQELKASPHIEQSTTAPEPRTTSKTIVENNPSDLISRIANRNSVERSTLPNLRTNNRTSLARNNSIQEQPTGSGNEQPKQNEGVPEQGTPRRQSQEQRTPARPGQKQTTPTRPGHGQSTKNKGVQEQGISRRPGQEQKTPIRPGQSQRISTRPGQEQRISTRPGQEQRISTRPGQEQRTPNRPLPTIVQQPQRKEQTDKFDRKVLYHERRNSVERSNSFKENTHAEKKDNNKRLDWAVHDRNRPRLDGKQSNAPDTRATTYNGPVGYRGTKDREMEPLNENLRSPVIRQEPLRRSIGTRGSYSDAVNLMPTEPKEQTVKEHRKVKEQSNKPPTAFGEEELPAYAEICPHDSHIYSSVESALSRPETDRINSSDQCAYSADHSLVSQSVADEEVQEILGTRRTNISTVVKTNIVLELPYIDNNAAINPNTVQHNIASKDFAQHPTSASTSQYKLPREEPVKGRLKHKLQLRPKEFITDQSSSEATLALPSPLPPSPIFVRGHKTRASDLVPTSDLHDIPDINMQQSFRASFPLRKSEWDRHPRRWGISPLVATAQQVSPPVPTSMIEKEGNALNQLSSSFPLLGSLGGIDFGISDQESYLQTPDSSVYTFNFDEVKPKVFTVSPFRAQRKSSPLSVNSVPQMPSTDDEIENRHRVIETVNVGLASPPVQRHKQNHQILPTRPGTIGQATSAHVVKPKVNIASSPEKPTSPHKPTYFYPPERLPSRVIDDNQTDVKQNVLNHKKETKGVSGQTSSPPSHSGGHNYSGVSPVEVQTKVRLSWGSSRPADANVVFLAFQDTLSQRTAWERQTFPPVQPQLMDGAHGPRPRTVGRAALRQVMRSEQSAQEEPLHQESPTDRFHFRIPPSNINPEPSPPLTGGPPPYSSVARELPPQRSPDRAPLQPHSSGQSNRQNRSDTTRRQPAFSLVL